jgi:ankyrin repeat protein
MNINNIKKEIENLQEKGLDESTIKAVIFSKYGEKYSFLFNERDSQSSQEQKEENISEPREKKSWLNDQQDHQIQINKRMIFIPLIIIVVAIVLFFYLVQVINENNDPFEIIKNIDVDELQTLVNRDENFNPNILDENNRSLFSVAVETNNSKEVINLLINEGGNVNENNNWRTPLMYAALSNNNPEVIELLINSGANVNAKNTHGLTPLYFAVSSENENSFAIIKLLLEHGANIRTRDPLMRQSILHTAADSNCSSDVFELLIEYNAEVNSVDRFKQTPLMLAAESCADPEIIDILLDSGADRDAWDNLARTASAYGKNNKNPEVLKRLMERGVLTPLMQAIMIGSYNDVKQAIEDGWDIQQTDNYGITPLMQAAFSNTPAVINLLLTYGSYDDIEKRSNDSYREMTPLMFAASRNLDEEMIFTLVNGAGADVEAKDKNNLTALMHAFDNSDNNIDVVKALISVGANVNSQDDYGKTPLMYAAKNKMSKEFTDLLLSNGANPNLQDKNGKTALMYAVEKYGRDYYDNFELILNLKWKTDVDIKDNKGRKARDFTKDVGLQWLLAK